MAIGSDLVTEVGPQPGQHVFLNLCHFIFSEMRSIHPGHQRSEDPGANKHGYTMLLARNCEETASINELLVLINATHNAFLLKNDVSTVHSTFVS